MYYRFKTGTFIKAGSFEEAKKEYIDRIRSEVENKKKWHKCTCLGFNHRHDCPEKHADGIPF